MSQPTTNLKGANIFKSPTAEALFIVAIVQLFCGALYGWFYWNSLDYTNWQGWLFVFSGLVFLALGVLVRWIKIYSMLIGFGFYLYLVLTVHAPKNTIFEAWQDGLILKLPILAFLLWGSVAGGDWKHFHKKKDLLLIVVLLFICGCGIQHEIVKINELNGGINEMQDSLKGAANILPKESRMTQIVSVICEANSELHKRSLIAGCVLGISSLGLFVVLAKLLILLKRRNGLDAPATEPVLPVEK